MNGRAIVLAGIALALVPLVACSGPAHQFRRAQGLERKGYYVEAGIKYLEISQKHPQHPLSPEALFRAGKIYQKKLKLYSRANHYFNTLLEKYGASPVWTARARQALFDSPDYFPLADRNSWVEGDSETGGRNMRAEWSCQAVSTATFSIVRRISAGDRLVAHVKRFYRKEGLELREYNDLRSPRYTLLISYPFVEGKSWKTYEEGKKFVFTIVSRTATVKVKAGEFSNCLKISEKDVSFPESIKYNYYAPEVGWVLTTIAAVNGKEHNNTELLSFVLTPQE